MDTPLFAGYSDVMDQAMHSIATPYLLFLGDTEDDLHAKTALGVAHWCPDACVGIWRTGASAEANGGLGTLPAMDPDRAVAKGARTLVVGIAPVGGQLPESFVAALAEGLRAGLDIASGLHTRLHSVPELVELAAANGRRLLDLREPGGPFPVGTGIDRPGRRLLTVGTDCAIGKMFTALTIHRELCRRGVAATFRATGQTGILIAGGGVPVDAVVSDFVAGAVETLTPENDPEHWDIIEGQGSLFHPGYAAVSLGLLHGAQPDAMVLCHQPGRQHVVDSPNHGVPDLETCIAANESAARLTNPNAKVIGISLHTGDQSEAEAERSIVETSERLGLPVGDPVRTGLSHLVDALL